MKMRHLIITAVCLFVAACSPKNDASVINEALAPEAFHAKLDSIPGAVLLDVRTPQETSQAVIQGATLLDFKAADFEQQLAGLDKSKTYFVYCAAGGRSAKAGELMKEKGFTTVYTLEGGINAWAEKGFPIVAP